MHVVLNLRERERERERKRKKVTLTLFFSGSLFIINKPHYYSLVRALPCAVLATRVNTLVNITQCISLSLSLNASAIYNSGTMAVSPPKRTSKQRNERDIDHDKMVYRGKRERERERERERDYLKLEFFYCLARATANYATTLITIIL